MAHVHQWYVKDYTLLTLPDAAGFADRFTAWSCVTCGKTDALAGCIRMEEPLADPRVVGSPDGGDVPCQGRAVGEAEA